MRRPPARGGGGCGGCGARLRGAPVGQGPSRRRGGAGRDPAGMGQGQPPQPGERSRGGSCPGTAGPSSAAGSGGPEPPGKGGRIGLSPVAPPRSTCEQHFPSGEGKSGWNKNNFSRSYRGGGGEIKSQYLPGLFSECEWTTLRSPSANNRRVYIYWKELI